ncbi:MAG TPA: flippase [Patescibacteria group bacterium]|nr:flippase [Patescibacteria group bacterium]
MSQLKSIASNTIVQLIGRVVGTVFGILTIAVLTRSLGADGYGQFTLAITFLAIAGALADFGFTLTTTQMISEKGANESKIVSNAFTLRMITGLTFFTLAVIVSIFMPYDAIVKLTIIVGSFSYFFMTSSQMLIGVYQKHMAMWRPALAEAVSRGLIFIIIIILAGVAPTVPNMMGAFVVGNLLLLIMNVGFAQKYAPVKLAWDSKIIKAYISRSWPIAISIFFNLLYLKGDIIFLSFYRDTAEIGLYGAAYKVLDVVSVIPTMFMGLILPLLVREWSNRSAKKVHELLQHALDFFGLMAFPMLGGALILATPIMTLVAGAEFEGSGQYLQVLMIANTVVFFGVLFGHAIVGINKQKFILPAYIVTAIVTTVLYLITIPKFGALGAAWSTVAAEILIALMTTSTVMYFTKFRPKLRNTFVYLISTALMTTLVWFGAQNIDLTPFNLLALIATAVIVYTLAVLALGGVKRETIRLITGKS